MAKKKKLDSYDLFRIFFLHHHQFTLTKEHNFEESEVTQS